MISASGLCDQLLSIHCLPSQPIRPVLHRYDTRRRQKKIPAGCPAGEGGMVEEIYIHYYRHLVQRKVTPFRKKNARNCSGENFPFCRYQVISRFELKSLVRKLLAMDIMAVFAAFLEISRRSL